MTVPTRTPLGASTLNRKWYLDVNVGTITSPSWIGVFGILEFQPNIDPTLQEDSDFDSGGYKSSSVTALAWTHEFKVARKTVVGNNTSYDPGQEALRLASNGMGTDNSVQVRWYEMTPNGPRVEAYQGLAAVSWTPDGGGMDANDSVTVTLTGQGVRTAIAHPEGTTVAPTITSLTPNTAVVAGGNLIIVTGTGFLAATDLKVGGVSVMAADWEATSDTKIALKAPAKSAGAQAVTVVNPGGTSAGSNLTYS